jgi:hypothetical protein
LGIRRQVLIGTGRTSDEGEYSVAYDPNKALDPAGGINLSVEVEAKGFPVVRSDTRIRASSRETVDATIVRDAHLSEWERLECRIVPLLHGLGLQELSADELKMLGDVGRIPLPILERRVRAEVEATRTQLPAWFHYLLESSAGRNRREAWLERSIATLQGAVASAVENGTVPTPSASEAKKLWALVKHLQRERVLNRPLQGRTVTVRSLLEIAAVKLDTPEGLPADLARIQLQAPGSWESLQRRLDLDDRVVSRLRLVSVLFDLTGEDRGLTAAIAGRFENTRDLAREMDEGSWLELLGGLDKQTVDSEARAERAAQLAVQTASLHPSLAAAARLSRHLDQSKHPAVAFVLEWANEDESFDLGTLRLDERLADRISASVSSDDGRKALADDLMGLQRLYRIHRDPQVMATLLDAGLDSAAAVVRLGRAQFVAKYGVDTKLGAERADHVFRQAEAVAARAFAMWAHFSPLVNTTATPTAISRDCPPELDPLPHYARLFGTLDGCVCEPCESVYSPAAYLADVLHFLKVRVLRDETHPNAARVPANGLNALDERAFCVGKGNVQTRRRRPDIVRTMLSCRNADTEMPYVDLVLEILENAVSGANTVFQTTLDAVDLAAQPEHANAAAYALLEQAVFPFSLPFDLWHEEGSAYLTSLGTSRSEITETCYPFKTGVPGLLQDARVARVRLGLSERQWKLIAEIPLAPAMPLSATWGFAPSARWWNPLKIVVTFLERSGLDYTELLKLLALRAFNPSAAVKLNTANASACDLRSISIDGLSAKLLGYLHRFLRLQRALGLSLRELDAALLALGVRGAAGRRVIDEPFLIRLANALRLRERTGRPLDEVVACWAPIDTADRSVPALSHEPEVRSLYERLFLDGRPGDASVAVFSLKADRSELSVTNEPFINHIPAVAAALGLPQESVVELVEEVLPPNALLTLENLSSMYRHALLAKTVRLSVSDYLVFRQWVGFDPFTALTIAPNDRVDAPAQTWRFIERVEAMVTAGSSVAELDFLLRQVMPFDHPTVAPSMEWVDEGLASLTQALTVPDPLENIRGMVTAARAIPAGGTLTATAALEMSALLGEARQSLASLGDGLDSAPLEQRLDLAISELAQEPLDATAVDARIDDVVAQLDALQTTFVETVIKPQLVQTVATLLDVPADSAGVLLYRVRFPADPSQFAGAVLIGHVHATAQGTAHAFTHVDLRTLVFRMVKAARVVTQMAISTDELTALCNAPAGKGWLDLSSLPAQDGDPPASLEAWLRLSALIRLRDDLPEGRQDQLFSLFDPAASFQPTSGHSPFAARDAYIGRLAEAAGLAMNDVAVLVGRGGTSVLNPVFPEDFHDERLPHRVLAAARLARRLGVTAAEMSAWVDPAAAENTKTAAIKNVLRARSGEEWHVTQQVLREPLREHQRQALVAYLLHEWHLERPDDLLDHFLIDVEMSPCMKTSRLVQATAAVQLFIQRVQLNLEPGLVLDPEGAEQWEWMKNYRVWEANRKIFLYPENWIEPDLRDDKTPIFEELERELRQSSITNVTAETALRHYLEKLHEVSRLQVCGQYVEGSLPTSRLHVFARTREAPHHYFYRRGELEIDVEGLLAGGAPTSAFDARWTPWERVDVDIEGDHLIPVVHNRRVYLFWPIFLSEDEAPLTHTLQSLLSIYGQMFRLLTSLGTLVDASFRSIGANTVGVTANGIISLLDGIHQLSGQLADVTDIQDTVRSIRDTLLGIFGASPLGDIGVMISGANNLAALGGVFREVVNLFTNYEQYLLSFLPAKRLKVQLAWSECRGDNWTAKRTSADFVSFRDILSLLFENLPELPGLSRDGVRRLFSFRTEVVQGELIVRCGVAMPDSLLNPETIEVLADSSITTLTDNNSAISRPAWLSKPLEIGHFRINTCAGQVEAVDSDEKIGFAQLFGQILDVMLSAGSDALQTFNQDRQLQQAGLPVTIDDDPDRPSPFRWYLDNTLQLPQHSRPHIAEPLEVTPVPVRDLDVYRISSYHQTDETLLKSFGFFYRDGQRTFFCFPWPIGKKGTRELGVVFLPFYHPYTCALIEKLERAGIGGLYSDRYQVSGDRVELSDNGNGALLQKALLDETYFAPPEYEPVDRVYRDSSGPRALRPIEEITFSSIAAYADYNWELFFHIPLLIATRLSADQQFRDAQRWFHYIFDPTDASRGSVPEKYWRTRPFAEQADADYAVEDIDQLMRLLNDEAAQPGLQELEWAVRKWRRDAFNPHLVARTRTVAYQKAVVMRYIDNLVAWGDALFRQATRESVNEALQLYVLASKLLGPRPRRIPRGDQRPERSFQDLEPTLDTFSNSLVRFENLQHSQVLRVPGTGELYGRDRALGAPLKRAWQVVQGPSLTNTASGDNLYFCVPPNEQLLGKWDLVADRLFKIRHCLDIDGLTLTLPLLSAPIDPAILVRAKALGVDINSVLADLYGQPSRYRFSVVVQKASELCTEVKALGGALLSAIEKRDGETIALLRNTHEERVLDAVKAVKLVHVEEAERSLEALQLQEASASVRLAHYMRLLGEFVNPEEALHLTLGAVGLQLQVMQFGGKMASAAASLIPNFKAGFVTTLGAMFGGDNIGYASERASDGLGHLASLLSAVGGLVQTMGGYRRRAEDWLLQTHTIALEKRGLAKQINAAELRRDITAIDLQTHALQIANNREMLDAMQDKFSNHDLYDWMVSRVAALHFQAYQMAYEMARNAERSFVAELGGPEPGLVRAVHWDSLKRGLLAGEHLYQDIKRLEVAYLTRNVREYELTKHVNLASLDPLSLLELRATGRCTFTIPEALFDLDTPGHYFRRIKTVALSMPCVAGPYTAVHSTLTLLKSGVRSTPAVTSPFASQIADLEESQSIVTSSALNDSGLLETNLKDERYLPFENAGVISEWRLELPTDPSRGSPCVFDYDTISDVVLHLRYTAREGGPALRKAASDHVKSLIDTAVADTAQTAGCLRLFSARHDFPAEWAQFKATSSAAGRRAELVLPIQPRHFPFWSVGRLNAVKGAAVIVRSTNSGSLVVYDRADQTDSSSRKENLVATFGGLHQAEFSNTSGGLPLPAQPASTVNLYFNDPTASDVWFLLKWSGS